MIVFEEPCVMSGYVFKTIALLWWSELKGSMIQIIIFMRDISSVEIYYKVASSDIL